MHGRLRFAAWLAALYGGVLAVAAATVMLVEAGMPAQDRAVLSRMLDERAPLLGFVGGLLLLVCGGLVAWLFKRYVTAPRALAEQTRVVLANPGYRVDAAGAAELAPSPPRSTAWRAHTTACRARRRRKSPNRARVWRRSATGWRR